MRELPGDREAVALGLAACRQLLNMSWRIGTDLEEARRLLEEGQALASAIDERSAHLLLSVLFARAVCGTGDVATYLELARENERAARDLGDEAVHAIASMWLMDALCFAARFAEAIRWADESLARFPRNLPAADPILGFAVHVGLVFWRGVCLDWTGQLTDGLEALARCRRLSDEDGTPEVAAYALTFTAEAHYHAQDADRALASARQLEDVSRALGEPPVLVALTHFAFSCAHLAAGRATDAIEPARASLELHGRVNRANAGFSATILAEALLAAGDLSAAQSAAQEAIAICRRTLRAGYEAMGHGVLARALLRRDGAAARDAIEAALGEAAALIERSGAKTLAPALCEWRAELAAVLGDDAERVRLLQQAQNLFDEIGAPLQAERLRG
jgi:tetratricopeptide (TPR) repeat protein